MKTTTTTDAKKAATEKRIATMRANLTAMEERAESILAKGEAMTAADRRELLGLVNVAYHKDKSKIEGLFSIDGSAACGFCQRMRKAAEDNILLICGGCYAAADAWKEAAWRRHKLNARILSTVLFSVQELQWLALPQRAQVRINEDGDTVNQTHGQNILRIFKAFPDCSFGYWFKNVPAVDAALKAEGITKREERPKTRVLCSLPCLSVSPRVLYGLQIAFSRSIRTPRRPPRPSPLARGSATVDAAARVVSIVTGPNLTTETSYSSLKFSALTRQPSPPSVPHMRPARPAWKTEDKPLTEAERRRLKSSAYSH